MEYWINNHVFTSKRSHCGYNKEAGRYRFGPARTACFHRLCTLFPGGELTRKDLIDRFAVGHAATTRDFALYKEIAPDNLKLDMRSKKYYKQPAFKPLFNLDLKKTLATVSLGYGDGFSGFQEFPISCESPEPLTIPKTAIMAVLCEGIYRNKAVEVEYISTSSGKGTREIVPHSLVDSGGNRWHVRSYDRKNARFMDVVCNRAVSARILDDSPPSSHEQAGEDRQWQKFIELELIPPHSSRESRGD